jgi:hypothetical protein
MAVARHFNVNFGLPQISFGFSGPQLCKFWLVVENRVFQRYRRNWVIQMAWPNFRSPPRCGSSAQSSRLTGADTGVRKFNYRLMTVVAARDKSHCSMASLAFLALRVERPFSNIPMS